MPAIFLLTAVLAAASIKATEACKQKMELSFIVDSSSTICGGNDPCENWKSVLQFCQKIVTSLDIGPADSKVAFTTFSEKVEKKWGLLQYTDKNQLLSAIGGVEYKGGEFADLLSAHILITEIFNPAYGENSDVPNVAFMITDGVPAINAAIAGATSIAIQSDAKGTLFVVCIKPGCNESWVKGVATVASLLKKPGRKTYFLVDNYSSLDGVIEAVLEEICAFLGR